MLEQATLFGASPHRLTCYHIDSIFQNLTPHLSCISEIIDDINFFCGKKMLWVVAIKSTTLSLHLERRWLVYFPSNNPRVIQLNRTERIHSFSRGSPGGHKIQTLSLTLEYQQIKSAVDFQRSDHRGGGNSGLDCCGCCFSTKTDGCLAGGGGDGPFLLTPPPPYPAFQNATFFASSSTSNGARSFTATSKTSHTHCLPFSGNIFRVARVAVSFAQIFAVNCVILPHRTPPNIDPFRIKETTQTM
jgi:hypothetical protein